jgi:hypothetical protein
VGVEVFARDDGSDDGTGDLLADYASRRPLVAHAGSHLGVVPGYFWLLERASPITDYLDTDSGSASVIESASRLHISRFFISKDSWGFSSGERSAY